MGQSILTSGSGSQNIPVGSTNLVIKAWGAGGGSGGGGAGNQDGGGGGGGGEFRQLDIASPATSYSYVVGAGGASGTKGLDGSAGNDTTINTTLVIGKAGGGGLAHPAVTGGSGGTGGTGADGNYDGGPGADGSGDYGGGGGGGAGSGSVGGSGSGSTGGAGGTGDNPDGSGGDGSTANSGQGGAGSAYGGGSGASTRNGTTAPNGAGGAIIFTWDDPAVTEQLAGQADGTGGATGAVNINKLISGQSNGEGTATGDLTISSPGIVELSGQADGVGTASGALINLLDYADNSDWVIKITLDKDYIGADLYNWLFEFDQAYSSHFTAVNGPLDADGTRPAKIDGSDFKFSTDYEGLNQLGTDVRFCSTANDPATAFLELAVKIPIVSSTVDTVIYLRWGNSGASLPPVGSSYGQYSAYDVHHIMVFDGRHWVDRTKHGVNFDSVYAGTPTIGDTGGPIGTHASFNGGLDVQATTLDFNWHGHGNKNLTFELLAKQVSDTGETYQGFMGQAFPGPSIYLELNSGNWGYALAGTVEAGSLWPDITDYHHAVIVKEGIGTDEVKFYLNGNADGTGTDAGSLANDVMNLGSGRHATGKYASDCEIAEARIHLTDRSASWVSASHDNFFNTSGFITFGEPESAKKKFLSGQANSVGSATGDLTVTGGGTVEQLAGQSDGVGTASGTLDISGAIALSGQADGIGSVTGFLNIQKSLAGQADGVGVAVGLLSRIAYLAGTASGEGTATGVLYLEDWYVDGSVGTTGDGSFGSPFKTIQEGINASYAGHNVYIRGGTYALTSRLDMVRSGVDGFPITITNYQDEKVVVDLTSITLEGFKWGAYKDYITINGIEIKNGQWPIVIKGDYNRIVNCEIYGGSSTAVGVWGGSYNYIGHNHIHDYGYNGVGIESRPNDGATGNANYNIIENNYIHHSGGHMGINVFPSTAQAQELMYGNIIRYNKIHDVPSSGIYLRRQVNGEVYYNLIYNCDMWGIFLHWQSSGDGVHDSNLKVYNNTILDTTNDAFDNHSHKGVILKNNIFEVKNDLQRAMDTSTEVGTSGHDIDYNMSYNVVQGIGYDLFAWDNLTLKYTLAEQRSNLGYSLNGQDAQATFHNRSGDDFRLATGSNGIGDGVDVGLTVDLAGNPIASPPSIGAYEYTPIEVLAGQADGIGTASGDLATGADVVLSGQADGIGSASGSLDVKKSLSGQADAFGSASGSLDIQGSISLSGQADGTGLASGSLDISGAVSLNGQSDGTGTASADININKSLSGLADGVGSASGTLTAGVYLNGIANGAGGASASLNLRKTLSGQSDGTGGASGLLSRYLALSGIANSIGIASGNLSVTGAGTVSLSGQADAVGSASGVLNFVGDFVKVLWTRIRDYIFRKKIEITNYLFIDEIEIRNGIFDSVLPPEYATIGEAVNYDSRIFDYFYYSEDNYRLLMSDQDQLLFGLITMTESGSVAQHTITVYDNLANYDRILIVTGFAQVIVYVRTSATNQIATAFTLDPLAVIGVEEKFYITYRMSTREFQVWRNGIYLGSKTAPILDPPMQDVPAGIQQIEVGYQTPGSYLYFTDDLEIARFFNESNVQVPVGENANRFSLKADKNEIFIVPSWRGNPEFTTLWKKGY